MKGESAGGGNEMSKSDGWSTAAIDTLMEWEWIRDTDLG